MTTRRQVLTGTAAMVAAMGLPFRAVRAATPADRKFVFVFNPGGWDPTRVFAAGFDNPDVSMEAEAEPFTAGGLRLVDHPDRPAVRSFFEAHHARSVVLNGMMVRSIAHEICTMIAMTGTTDGAAPDWPALLASARQADFVLPHLVLDGPSFPGDLGVAVARTGVSGQLSALLSGKALDWSDQPVRTLKAPSESVVDRYLARRIAARADYPLGAVDAKLTSDLRGSHEKARALQDLQYGLDLGGSNGFDDQISAAVDALALGVSRCVTISHAGGQLGWDTHTNNDAGQSGLWESLFQGLGQLVALLDGTPGTSAPTLAEETTIVVLSEMGRTPRINAFDGKDHWPYTSALLFGAGLEGGRQIGEFDANWYGKPVDSATGELSEAGQVLSAEVLGATLLAMADIDPEAYVSGVSPLQGLLT